MPKFILIKFTFNCIINVKNSKDLGRQVDFIYRYKFANSTSNEDSQESTVHHGKSLMQKESRADNLNRKMKKSCHQVMLSSFVKYIIHEVYITLQLSMIYPVIYLRAIQQKSRPGSSCLEYQTKTGKICNSKSHQYFRTASLVTWYIEFSD